MVDVLIIESTGRVGIGGYEEETCVDDTWTHVRHKESHFSRDRVQIQGNVVTVRTPRFTREETSESVELRMLLAKWRAEGKASLADIIEFSPSGGESVLEFLVEHVPAEPLLSEYPLSECAFIKRSVRFPSTNLHITQGP